MSVQDRERWESRHRLAQAPAASPSAALRLLPRATAAGAVCLDLACGRGRNLTKLLELGYHPVGVDISEPGLILARNQGGDCQPEVVQADLDTWPFAANVLDAAIQIDFLDRRLFPELRLSLKAGAPLLIETFLDLGHVNQSGPRRPGWKLRPGELRSTFSDWEILECNETDGASARATLLALCPD